MAFGLARIIAALQKNNFAEIMFAGVEFTRRTFWPSKNDSYVSIEVKALPFSARSVRPLIALKYAWKI